MSVSHRRRLAAAAGALTTGALAMGALAWSTAALPAAASTVASGSGAPSAHYTFSTHDNSNDLTFNQLLGINKAGTIAGYFGSGARGHKNKGYLLVRPYKQRDYRVENFPNSAQTQVTGLNDTGITVGFYARTNKKNPADNANFGFYKLKGKYHAVVFPTSNISAPPVNQLLGVNDSGWAVGFWVGKSGNARGYEYNVYSHTFRKVTISGETSLTATGINNHGDITGFFTPKGGSVESFLLSHAGHLTTFAAAGADMTQAFGVNDKGEVVGATTVGAKTYGFTWTAGGGFVTVNDPAGVGSTIINGVNDAGDLVGFYNSANGRTHGMLAVP